MYQRAIDHPHYHIDIDLTNNHESEISIFSLNEQVIRRKRFLYATIQSAIHSERSNRIANSGIHRLAS